MSPAAVLITHVLGFQAALEVGFLIIKGVKVKDLIGSYEERESLKSYSS